MMDTININTNKEQLDINFVNSFLSTTHWAKDRTPETMKTCMEHSLNFGVYFNNKQIGYARVLTDYVQFAYVLDVFIDEAHRGKGYSKELMKYIVEYEPLKKVSVWRLSTTDAHELYKKFGFKVSAKPQNLMELMR